MTDNNPDLQDVLRTLANIAAAQAPVQTPPQVPLPSATPESAHGAQASSSTGVGVHQVSSPEMVVPRSAAAAAPATTPVPEVDPSTITEWKQALRFVTKLAVQDPGFVPAVQRLMRIHDANLKQWEASLERVQAEQVAKREEEQALRASTLPGLLKNSAPLRTPELEQQEIAQYHQKVHKRAGEMQEAQSLEMKKMGVPFYCIYEDLVVEEGEAPGKVTKDQLLKLKRQMNQHLEDMYRE